MVGPGDLNQGQPPQAYAAPTPVYASPPPTVPYASAPPPNPNIPPTVTAIGYAPGPGYAQPPIQPVMMIPTIATGPPAIVPIIGQDPLLEGLLAFPGLLIKQEIRDLCTEMYCRWAQSNRYSIYNPSFGAGWYQQKILHVKEDSSCIERFCFRSWRGLTLRVFTADEREVILIDRPFHPCAKGGCCCYCSDVFFQVIDVFSGRDTFFGNRKLGRVKQNFSFFQPYLTVYDDSGEEIYRVLASCISCGRRSFRIFRAHEQNMEKPNQIGKIRKKWGGFTKEFLTNCDNFSIRFPVNATHVQRALIIATCLFIDYLYYENAQTAVDGIAINLANI